MLGLVKRVLEGSDVAQARRRAEADATPRATLELCERLLRNNRRSEVRKILDGALHRFPYCSEMRALSVTLARKAEPGLLREAELALTSEDRDVVRGALAWSLGIGHIGLTQGLSDRLAQVAGEDATAWLESGLAALAQLQLERSARGGREALARLERAVALDPLAVAPRLALAQTHAFIGDSGGALRHLFEARDAQPGDERIEAMVAQLRDLPLEALDIEELLSRLEESDEAPALGQKVGGDRMQAWRSTLERISMMEGVQRVLLQDGPATVAAEDGMVRTRANSEQDELQAMARRFRQSAALSSKRMGIGGFLEAELAGGSGAIMVVAAGASVALAQLTSHSNIQPVAVALRDLLAGVSRKDEEHA